MEYDTLTYRILRVTKYMIYSASRVSAAPITFALHLKGKGDIINHFTLTGK